MSKKTALSRINQRAGTAAPATVSSVGVYTGGGDNDLGNWIVGPNSLSANKVILCSDGWIEVGDDTGTVRLDAVNPTYRIWAGLWPPAARSVAGRLARTSCMPV